MDKRSTFLLSLATTLTVGWFAIIGAFYVEMTKLKKEDINYDLVDGLVLAMLIVGAVCVLLFTGVGINVYRNNDDNG